MRWEEVCENKQLQDLPFKIELNKWGQIIMSPVKIKHSFYQGRIQRLLESLLKTGEVMPECAINTSDGVKVADVVWCSDQRFDQIQDEISASIAPEICIEVKSTGNTFEEMEFKKKLYLESQAIEVWLCNEQGQIKFYNEQGGLSQSLLVPDFPNQIKR
ncbi:Uma2 family endonuclease [Dolichospermum sp. ST_sed1]|nr:Uma2 family endonuclease [Dolichospermum sp. ST_sed1]MDD1423850.1 Uma2 family endonuclease [Dolichospermum sp. ST_sed9]MDD1429679.1 Uma2 family endonuclease [Dolichospermum sp. ST_sed6]MDD1435995.1 Uma2 family endonuclease [Dolichospermum sp. ST_sed10]MDD1439290.1 Uma2 family endonuclease [Dolichospermum sp. ST_sed3]MDD1445072.1 Uma2 family endonuclease [Dolichospermum sp. ST_sed8]MDD1456069.1 Uma2 family endonuclease [Dolichospermum sp. ST_sed7]MDD1459274.1 Uma2 family endonuclease [Doli